ncbi:MAG: bifunctional diaminohydroxyphosphoribosylaminopyrimidine deaminase/5-amino-6-(5-phosphoribosylamino)uracil reductase RibD [Dokdonella sp.]
MTRALRLAERGMFTTQPNPRVGCVIAKAGAVVGEGWHQRAGEAHAEVFALRAAGESARDATAYVTLEPCGKHGRTPPCADALIAAGVARVVIASEDPNQHGGGALERLRTAGITIESGLLRASARDLNRGFFSRIERGRPWLRIKLAMSLDGRTALANGDSKWITEVPARADVQRWRARSSALMSASGTVLADNPRLTVRTEELDSLHDDPRSNDSRITFVPPLRVVLDRELRTPASAHVLDGTAPTLVAHSANASPVDARFERVERAAIEMQDGRLDLDAMMKMLATRGVNEMQVESGPTLCGALVDAGLVDELLLYVAPVLLGDSARPLLASPALTRMTQRRSMQILEQRQIGDDLRLLMRPVATN